MRDILDTIPVTVVPAELSVCDGASSFLQSGFWGTFKARFGWEPLAFLVGRGEAGGPRPLLIIRRPLGPGLSFAYAPWGPEWDDPAPDAGEGDPRPPALAELARRLAPRLPKDTAFIRFDPPWYREEGAGCSGEGLGRPFRRAAADVQPPDTVIVDLRPPPEALLAAMKPKTRYNIGLAAKRGVTARRAGEGELDVFYRLLSETSRRDGIAVHGIEYYRGLFELARTYGGGRQGKGAGEGPGFPAAPDLRLYLAEYEGEALAAVVTLFRGAGAVYLYGASSDRHRNLMAPYLLQWRAMTDARAAGCRFYDLFGIPPGDDPGHPMAGLYRFKTGFGGRIIHRPGSWDYALRPLGAALFHAAEYARKRFRDRKKRR
ncbi:MAG: peptidoglycan bridge formation glycyltransferase FemA/FemB family protein [Treponema sp.]|jgi:lipid II:glycine glycyltransferase (peptidoglycan interpeptide bridge formation enzyme)|nr:peptidoglycan bridge formation glycyltransferase FemA/FemB family protein [Treponema sp.]